MHSRKVDEDAPTSRRAIECAFDIGNVLETALFRQTLFNKTFANKTLIFMKPPVLGEFPDSLLGPGPLESVYANALRLELAEQQIPFERQKEWIVRSRIFFGSFAFICVHLRQKRKYRVSSMVGTAHPMVG